MKSKINIKKYSKKNKKTKKINNKKYSRKNKINKNSNSKISKMSGGVLSDEVIEILQSLRDNNPKLIRLDISYNNIGDAGATALAEALKSNTSLKDLNIGKNNIGAAGATALAKALETNTSLKYLNIGNNNIGDAGASPISQLLIINTSLTILIINNCNIGDAGVQALAKALETNKTLTEFIISENKFGDAGAKAFAEALKVNTSLTDLDIKYNEFKYEIEIQIKNALIKINFSKNNFYPRLVSLNVVNNNDIHRNGDNINFIKKFIVSQYNLSNNNKSSNVRTEDEFNKLKISLVGNDLNFQKLINNNYNKGKEAMGILKTDLISLTNKSDSKAKLYLIDLHGNTEHNIFKLPHNVNIVFLSPAKYLTLCNQNIFSEKLGSQFLKYLNNPNCFTEEPDNYFNQAVIYYGGQYCIDLKLSRSNDTSIKKEYVTGLHIINGDGKATSENKYHIGELDILLSKILNTDFNNPGINYTILLTSCRSSDDEITDLLVFYEQIIKILNFKLYYDLDYKKIKMSDVSSLSNVSSNNADIELNDLYKKCRKAKVSSYDLYQGQTFTTRQSSIKSRTGIYSTNNSTNNSIKIKTLSSIISTIDDDNKFEIFKILLDDEYLKLDVYSNMDIYITLRNNKIIERIGKIFDGSSKNYNLMFEYLYYCYCNYSFTRQTVVLNRIFLKLCIDIIPNFISKITSINLSKFSSIPFSMKNKQFSQAQIDSFKLKFFKEPSNINFITDYLSTENIVLTTLIMESNNIGDAGATALATALKTNSSLTKLDISVNNIGDAGATALATALKTNSSLTKLDISVNNIGDAGVTDLATALKTNSSLTKLDISVNNIGEAGATDLAEALKNNTLIELNIYKNKIGKDGATALATALATNSSLTKLFISYNNIGDDGAKALAGALKTNKDLKLTTLDISYNHIGDTGATALSEALEKNTSLTEFNTYGFLCSDDIRKNIKAALEKNKLLVKT